MARLLNEANLATLLIDLLTLHEEVIDARTSQLRFDIELLAERLVDATDWLTQSPDTKDLRIGYFGASTGAAAALQAAAVRPEAAGAIVSRGGRPDLAGMALVRVQAPTLLIVGENDEQVIRLNREALAKLHCEKQLLSLLGNIAEGDDGKASLHLHAVLGLRDGSVRGGHFCTERFGPR